MMMPVKKILSLAGIGLLGLLLLAETAEARTNFAKPGGLGLGIRGGAYLPSTELDGKFERHGAVFMRYGLMNRLQSEVTVGYGHLVTEDVRWVPNPAAPELLILDPQGTLVDYMTHLSFVELRLLFAPVIFERWNPFFYGGAGYVYFNVDKESTTPRRGDFKGIGSTLGIPLGLGIRYEIGKRFGLEGSGGYTFTFSDRLDEVRNEDGNDNFWQMTLGVTYDIIPARVEPVPVPPPVVPPPPPPVIPVPPVVEVPPPVVEVIDIDLPVVYFAIGGDDLAAVSIQELNAAVSLLMQHRGLLVEVTGHSDSAGFPTDNMRLSWKRAHTVKDYLAEQGVPAWRMTVMGFGDRQPIASNDTAEGRARNRRAELEAIQ